MLLFVGMACSLQAQDKLVRRNGRTIEVYVQRSVGDQIEYTYPGGTFIYKRPKSDVSYILYQDGRKEIYDESLREAEKKEDDRTSQQERTTADRVSSTKAGAKTKPLPDDDEIIWADVKTTFNDADVSDLTRLKRISAISSVSYKDAIQKLKKSAAVIGATTILIMDIPENEEEKVSIEVMGIAYRDESLVHTPKAEEERPAPVESQSTVRRRRIAQRMESYNDESNLEFEDYSQKPKQSTPQKTKSASTARNDRASTRESYDKADSPDAIYMTNGRVIRGTIEEFEPDDDFVSIRTTAGEIYEYSMDDVKRVSRGVARDGGARSSQPSKTAAQRPARNASRYDDDDSRYRSRSSSKPAKVKDDYYDDSSVSSYKGLFEAGYAFSFGVAEKGRFEMSTTHGYLINRSFFVGAGVGMHLYSARDPNLKKNMGTDKYPQYANPGELIEGTNENMQPTSYVHGMDSSFIMLPVFVELRGYLPLENSLLGPFASVKVGYSFNLSDGFGPSGLYFAPSIGAKFNLSPKIGLLLSMGYTFQGLGDPKTTVKEDKDGNTIYTTNRQYGFYYRGTDEALYKTTSAQGINIKVGIEF
jgi:hypothetical protein